MLPGTVSKLQRPGSNDDKQSSSGSPPPAAARIPVRGAIRNLRSYISAVTAFRYGRKFQVKPSIYRKRAVESVVDNEGLQGAGLTTLYVGVSAVLTEKHTVAVAIAIRDTVYLHDFSVNHLDLGDDLTHDITSNRDIITEYIIGELFSYERKNICKFIGAGIPFDLMQMAPTLCSQLWAKLDVISMLLKPDEDANDPAGKDRSYWNVKDIDEQADSMARKCIMFFGPEQSPLLQVGYRGLVEVDAGFRSHMCSIQDYQATCGETTWASMMKFATDLRKKGTKIAFFSATPQGDGVALMRHALVRFARTIGTDLTWYVPKPNPGVFRITKIVHNILQGVAKPDERISSEEKQSLTDWIRDNADRYWLSKGGPLRDPSEGGADVIIIDDPQMTGLIPLAKGVNQKRPVFYRSHIPIRRDMIEKDGTPQADIWQFLWENIQHADVFISYPSPAFVPENVPRSKLAYLPAATDWIDGLNKTLNEWDMGYYIHLYNMQCLSARMQAIAPISQGLMANTAKSAGLNSSSLLVRTSNCPASQLLQTKKGVGKYFIHIAHFDLSKSIPDVIKSYAEFYNLLHAQSNTEDANSIPQLLIVGNGSINDPEGTVIYDKSMPCLEAYATHMISSISIMRLLPNDQLLNTLLSNAHVALQLSIGEGFEVKVSEALRKGRPVIATQAGDTPLQVQHGRNGFLVEPRDWKEVAKRLMELWTDEELHRRMSKFASASVSDEVGSVGNALSWFYLAAKWTGGEGTVEGMSVIEPKERWVNDLARAEAGAPYKEGENRLPRSNVK